MEKTKVKRSQKVVLKSHMTVEIFKIKIKDLGFTKASFARYVGINEQTVRGWKSGMIPLYIDTLINLIEFKKLVDDAKETLDKIYYNNINMIKDENFA